MSMNTNCTYRSTFMEDRQVFESDSESPSCKVRRRTSSDATCMIIRRRALHAECNEVVADYGRGKAVDVGAAAEGAACADHRQFAAMNDSLMTISSMNYARPSDTLIAQAKVLPVGDKMMAVEHTTCDIIDAHLITSVHTVDTVIRGMLMCQIAGKAKLPGDVSKMFQPPDPEKMWEMFTSNMQATIKRVSVFASLLPGFSKLDADDQKALFKQGSFEVILARYARCFTEDGMMTPDMTMMIPRQLIYSLPLGDLFMEQYDFADIFNRLELSDSELALVCAVVLINPERNGLNDIMAVEQLQLDYLRCLYGYLRKYHRDDLFEKILDLMPLSSAVNESHARKVNAMKTSDEINGNMSFPDIHNDIYM